MIESPDDYAEVLALLRQRDTRRSPHRLPLERYGFSDCEYFLTLCARGQGQPFADHTFARAIIDALQWRKERHGWHLFCYCLMPDHLHFLIRLVDDSSDTRYAGARGIELEGILHQVADYKSYTTSQLWWKTGGHGPLWQHSSYDRVIRYNESIEHTVNYVLNNPVRKGLVDTWEQYPFARIVDHW